MLNHRTQFFSMCQNKLITSSGPLVSDVNTVGLSDTEAPLDQNGRTAMYISEAGLYKLDFRCKAPLAEEFTDYVCSEVLPTIRQYCNYMTNEEALIKIRNLCGESALHYRVREHIEKRYTEVIISASHGKNQKAPFMRLDSKLKGYTKGEF